MDSDHFFVAGRFDELLEDLTSGAPVSFDFEISYTSHFFQKITENSNETVIQKHFLQQYGCYHTWEHSEEFDTTGPNPTTYKPQWQLGFYVRKKFFFVTNVEPYVAESKKFMDRLRPLLPLVHLVGQNVKFDLAILAQIMDLTEREVLGLHVNDLMTHGYARNLEHKRFNLAEAARRHIPTVVKGDTKVFDIDGEFVSAEWKHSEEWHRSLLSTRLDETIKYNRDDLLVTDKIYEVLCKELSDLGVLSQVSQIYTWFIPLYSQIEQNGLLIDPEESKKAYYDSARDGLVARAEILKDSVELLRLIRVSSYAEKLQLEILKKFACFNSETGELRLQAVTKTKKNILEYDSSQFVSIQTISGSLFREFLSTLTADVFGFELPKTKTGYAFQQDSIADVCKILQVSENPIKQCLYRVLSKMLEVNSLKANLARIYAFYLLPSKVYPKKRLHSDYKLTGTETGRLSSVRPGVMNLPMRIKRLVIGRKGFCQVDLRSAEAKLFMLFTQNESILEELKTNDDTYSVIGMRVFSLKEMSKKTRPIERNIMKIGVLAKMYGQDIGGMAQQIELYYKPVLWEFVANPAKYQFVYDWNCVKFDSEANAEILTKAKEHLKVFEDSGKNPQNAEHLDSDQELQRLLQELSSRVTLDYFTIAEKCDRRLEEAIDSDVYEDWVCRNFVDFENPEESKLISPAGLIRTFDMSAEGLFFGLGTSTIDKKRLHNLLMQAYWTFFINKESFVGEYFTGTEFVKIERRRLHAFSSFLKKLRFAARRRDRAAQKQPGQKRIQKITDIAGLTSYDRTELIDTLLKHGEKFINEEDLEMLLIGLIQDSKLLQPFLKAAQRFAARYRESLNLPVQGMSSFLNSKIAFEAYKACIDPDCRESLVYDSKMFPNNMLPCGVQVNNGKPVDVKIVNTVHDANHFDFGFEISKAKDYTEHPEDQQRFQAIVKAVYDSPQYVQELLETGLRAIHPTKDTLRYIPIGGDFEFCQRLSEAK